MDKMDIFSRNKNGLLRQKLEEKSSIFVQRQKFHFSRNKNGLLRQKLEVEIGVILDPPDFVTV